LQSPGIGAMERLKLIREAGEVRDLSALKGLVTALKDENAIVRSEAARSLGDLGSDEAVAPLAGCLEDPSASVRISSARSLGRLDARGAVSPLVSALAANRGRADGYGPQVRTEIIRALRALRDRRAVKPLLAELEMREDLSYKNEVVMALGAIGAPDAIMAIRKHLAVLESNKPREKIALFPWKEAVEIARGALRELHNLEHREEV
jgi:HEAT repeat protein